MGEAQVPIEILRRSLAGRRRGVQALLPGAQPKPSAVLVPLFVKDGEPHLLLTRRTMDVEHYKGHISFPGGARHPEDDTLRDTALREAHEEVGLVPAQVDVVGEMDSFYSASGGFLITPFVGLIPHPYPFRLHPAEVRDLLEVPLSFFMDGCHHWKEMRPDGRMGYFWDYRGKVIWGSTGRIIRELLDIMIEEGLLVCSEETTPRP